MSLTSVLLKVPECSTGKHISKPEAILHGEPNEYVLLKQISCLTNLICFFDEVTRRIDVMLSVEICDLDFSKVFSLVNHRILPLNL